MNDSYISHTYVFPKVTDHLLRRLFLKVFGPIVTIRDGNDPDQCRRLTLFDAFQVVVNDKNVPFFNLISHHIALISFPLLIKFKSTYLNCLSRLQFDCYFKIVWPIISSPTLVDFVRIVFTIQGCRKV